MEKTIKVIGKIDLSKFDKPKTKYLCSHCGVDSFTKPLYRVPFTGVLCEDCRSSGK